MDVIAGFFDGDGSVYINTQTGGYCLHVSLSQCDYRILVHYQKAIGGRLFKQDRANPNHRLQYDLQFRGWDAYDLLQKLRPFLRVKAHSADIAIQFMETFYRAPDCPEKQVLVQALASENAAVARTVLSRCPITIGYISGIFDAEGCCMHDRISITQQQEPTLLKEIQDYFQAGTIWNETAWYLKESSVRKAALHAMLPNIIVKREQAELTIKYIDGDKTVATQIKDLKHVNYDLSTEELNKINSQQPDGRASDTRNDPEHVPRYAANMAARERASARGPVHKGPRTATMINNAIVTCYERGATKRKITDDQILEVKRRLAARESGNSIAKSMGLHSAQIYNIRDGLLLPLSVLKASDNPVELNKKARNDFLRQEDELTIAIKKASRILGGNNNRALDDETMLKIRQELKEGKMSKNIAETYNINPSIVAKVKAGKLQTVAEVREKARKEGVYVDAVRVTKDKTTTVYPDVWAAASATGNKPWQILTWLDEGKPVNDLIWQKTGGESAAASTVM
jgi:hypothetical protein